MRILLSTVFAFMTNFALAQSVEMADQFRADGKIYVVIAVIGTLLLGFFVYLIVMDNKLSKLEKRMKEREQEG